MYLDKKLDRTWMLVLGLILALVLAALFAYGSRIENQDLRDEGAAAIQAAIKRGALQCYAVEGVYPPNLQYLEDHYGLQINDRDYYVTYDAFASNLPPDVRVAHRTAD